MSATFPRLRPEIDAVPTAQDGEPLFVLYDRTGLSPAELAVSPVVMLVANCLDGETAILDIYDHFRREAGREVLTCAEIQTIVEELEKALFLDGDRFRDHFDRIRSDYEEAAVREPTSAGAAYPDDPGELARLLDGMLEAAPPDEEPEAGEAPDVRPPPRGIIIPHIDFARGGAGYGQAYRPLSARPAPDLVVCFGTAHYPIENRFALCEKDFAVPGGTVRTARDLVEALRERCRSVADFTEDAFAHRGEHSVELQAVWLRHLWGDDVRILPVLAGSLHEFLGEDGAGEGDPARDPEIRAFLGALGELLPDAGRVLVMASADLAHVGPRFGDDRDIEESFLEEVETADRAYLAAVASGDADEAALNLRAHGDRYHVCGTASIYALGALLPGVRGRLLGYHQAAHAELQQMVSFASMIFE